LRLQDCLDRLSESELRHIAQNLGTGPKDDFKRPWITSEIIKVLTRIDLLNKRALRHLDNESLCTLKEIVFNGGTTDQQKCLGQLEQYGLVFEGVIPDEIMAILFQFLRPLIVKRITNTAEKVIPSPFIKLVLLLGLIQNEHVFISSKTKQREKCLKKISTALLLVGQEQMISTLIQYVIQKNIVTLRNDY